MTGKQFMELVKNLTLLTQLGFSFITPLLLCVGICWWLTSKLGVGGWVFIPGFFFGLGGSFSFALRVYRMVMREDTKDGSGDRNDRRRGVFHNRHI